MGVKTAIDTVFWWGLVFDDVWMDLKKISKFVWNWKLDSSLSMEVEINHLVLIFDADNGYKEPVAISPISKGNKIL